MFDFKHWERMIKNPQEGGYAVRYFHHPYYKYGIYLGRSFRVLQQEIIYQNNEHNISKIVANYRNVPIVTYTPQEIVIKIDNQFTARSLSDKLRRVLGVNVQISYGKIWALGDYPNRLILDHHNRNQNVEIRYNIENKSWTQTVVDRVIPGAAPAAPARAPVVPKKSPKDPKSRTFPINWHEARSIFTIGVMPGVIRKFPEKPKEDFEFQINQAKHNSIILFYKNAPAIEFSPESINVIQDYPDDPIFKSAQSEILSGN